MSTRAALSHRITIPTSAPWDFERRDIGPNDIQIDIAYCGLCHTDIHQISSDWGSGTFPMVLGHEIVGKIINIGSDVKKLKQVT